MLNCSYGGPKKVNILNSIRSADVMASNSESEQILEMAIAGISRVALAIAAMPAEDRARALEAAERSYCQTALNLGYAEAQAESWVAALMFRLRAEMEKQKSEK